LKHWDLKKLKSDKFFMSNPPQNYGVSVKERLAERVTDGRKDEETAYPCYRISRQVSRKTYEAWL